MLCAGRKIMIQMGMAALKAYAWQGRGTCLDFILIEMDIFTWLCIDE